MRLIDADALMIAVEKEFDGCCVYDVSPSEAVSDIERIVDSMPTIAGLPSFDLRANAVFDRAMSGRDLRFGETDERERDAAVEDLNMCCPCEVCSRSCQYDKVNPYDECADFMWRGVQKEKI